MKQLLLYFLFFVGAALVFIQCAMLFPTINKPPKHLSRGTSNTGDVIFDIKNQLPVMPYYPAGIDISTKNRVVWPFFNDSVFPYRMMQYINRYPPFYSPYINFSYYDLVNKYSRKSKNSR